MTNEVSVNPTPIQRNRFDVAIELVNLENKVFGFSSSEEIEKSFAKYYSLASRLARYQNSDILDNFLNEEILEKFNR